MVSGASIGLGARLTAHSAASGGYQLECRDTGSGTEAALIKGLATNLATSATYTSATVTGARLTVTGSTLKGYLRISGVWTEVVSATDSTYTAAGYPGFWVLGAHPIESVLWGPDSSAADVTPEFSSDQDDGVWVELTERGEQGGAAGWAGSDGSKYQWALVAKRRERLRLRLTVTGVTARFVLRSIELMLRPSGKQ
jgi:hypothetical protein